MLRTFDETAGASYTILNETADRKIAKTVQVSDRCNVDIDAEGFPIGVEVLLGDRDIKIK